LALGVMPLFSTRPKSHRMLGGFGGLLSKSSLRPYPTGVFAGWLLSGLCLPRVRLKRALASATARKPAPAAVFIHTITSTLRGLLFLAKPTVSPHQLLIKRGDPVF